MVIRLRQCMIVSTPPRSFSLYFQDQGSGGGPGLSQELSVGRSGDMNGPDAVRRMLQLLGPQGEALSAKEGSETAKAGQGTSVEDFPALLGESYLRGATHSTATRMRSRLFQVWFVARPAVSVVGKGGRGRGLTPVV